MHISKNYHVDSKFSMKKKLFLQMLQAMSLYSNQARGSASQKFSELLIEECTNYWMAGRQACEELSLTG